MFLDPVDSLDIEIKGLQALLWRNLPFQPGKPLKCVALLADEPLPTPEELVARINSEDQALS